MKTKVVFLFMLMVILLVSLPNYCQDDPIKERFLKRKPILDQLKNDGFIGENNQGYVEFRISNDEYTELVEQENADRRVIYQRIAKRHGTDVEVVGRRRAVQIAKIAKKGHWLQDEEGRWYRKE
jgi:uncharacterized protein YdbL (DUF1318 family)